jgi:hypothetical protein
MFFSAASAAIRSPQNSLLAVHLHRVFADDFRKFSGSGAPQHVHLPQPVLRGHIPLRKE